MAGVRWGRWLDARWYVYLWRRAGPETKIAVAGLTLAILGGGGFYLATLESSAHAAGPDAYILRRSTVVKTVMRDGSVKRVRVVQTVKVPARAVTVDSLRTITRAGGVKTVPVTRVKYVPVTKTATVSRVVTDVLTRRGKTTTVVNTRPVTVESTVPVTVSETQTELQTVTQSQTVTTQRVTTVGVTTTVVRTTTVVHTEPVTTTVVVTVPQTTTKAS
jgi:hypothetical protein